uniref:Uncharacterized protein n=1 Tax=Dunaliella tertiolecta TaxID=3047 RepID=A0A7S3RA13_DUNTE|mmetsp:Transcript_5435/g.14673  ORF Transcript_5435/g.14673 Transcript_5435/m.14673 type:complete len:417 (+) Transcript_5435:182-1432(+)|eukprot:CAMPEP_0202344446 /NCGR_PEP_ID=MMETSP1126-20121109/4126_1 /ASSEMBLY_ACC=CAM_ASM_000457 /TAXON_ID=3047 /ORGANISM="Dunaliella tertiolecta, Strain CCMP1320" /LENGTH=416 /DNA_ID=CAMNT_0048935641 /DNA_START=33 /DNA_END=1283 /DNA_ORIENTATION=-
MFSNMSSSVTQGLFGSSFTAAAAAPPAGAEKQKKTVAAPYGSIGAWAEEVLYGKRGVGAYAVDHTGTLKSKTASGLSITGTTTKSGATGAVSTSLKAATPVALPLLIKKQPDGKRSISLDARPKAEKEVEGTVPSLNMTASLASNGKLNVDLSSKVMCSTTATLSTTLMQPSAPSSEFLAKALAKQLSQKLAVEYAGSNVNANVNATLNASPVIGLTAATGVGAMVFGTDMKFDTGKATSAASEAAASAPNTPGATPAARAAAGLVGGLSSWTLGANYTYDVHQVAAFLSNGAKASKTAAPTVKARLAYGWKMSDRSALGLEVGQELSLAPLYSAPAPAAAYPTTVSVGVSSKVPASSSSALAKWRVDSNGMVSLHYSDVLLVPGGPPLAVSASAVVNGLQPFSKPPRVGISAELA